MLSLKSATEKYILNTSLDWLTLFFWSEIIGVIVVLALLVIPQYKNAVLGDGFQAFKMNR